MPEAFICDAVRTPIGRYAGALAAGSGAAGAGVGCCANAGSASTRVPRVPASSIARRFEDRNVIVILPNAKAVLSAASSSGWAPSVPVSDFCNPRAIAEAARWPRRGFVR